MSIVIAHVSDVHIDHVGQDTPEGVRSIRRARAVLDYLDDLPYDLDAVVVTGDIADHGEPAEYDSARELLESRHPTLVCPGNHDERAAFRRHFLRTEVAGSSDVAPINQVLRLDGCVIAACDSSVPGKNDGYLDAETLDWLETVLHRTEPDVPVLVAFHHPPQPLHIPFMDVMRQFGAERLAALGEQYPNIAGYLCGHAHTAPPPCSPTARCWWRPAWSPRCGCPGRIPPPGTTSSISTSRRHSPSTSSTRIGG